MNVGKIDRIVRYALGVLLIVAPFLSGASLFQGAMTWVSVAVGVVLIATAGMKFCPLYRILGVNTCKL
jgi:hypothetical protein